MSVFAFLFPGQGSQRIAMGKELYSKFPPIRSFYETAEKLTGLKLIKTCFYGTESDLKQTVISQIAIFLNEVCSAEILKQQRLKPQALFGIDSGLYAALVVAEVLTFSDGLALLKKRAEIMEELTKKQPGMMFHAVGLKEEDLQQLCLEMSAERRLEVAFRLNATHMILSGTNKAAIKFLAVAKSKGLVKTDLWLQEGAFHSSLMVEGAGKMRPLLNNVQYQPFKIPAICPTNGQFYSGIEELKENLCFEFSQPVEWESSVKRLKQEGCFTMLEVGPGRVLSLWAGRVDRGIRTLNVEDSKSLSLALKLAN